ncbi:MAG: hypothetical protein K5979_14470 [Ruminococcus sp.]|nr:hypothetical protein [Ruminococcus sp.]
MEVKTNPFYELRDRLYASASAGCSLIAEDFRLKRAIDNFQPMSEANKVFGKLYAMCVKLLDSDNKASDIVDCIALADALAVTQGTFADDSETSPVLSSEFLKTAHISLKTVNEYKEQIRKASYNEQEFGSDFAGVIRDPRVYSAFLEAAGRNSVYLNKMLVDAEAVCGEPLLRSMLRSLDLTNPNATGNQIRFVSQYTHDKFNDRYVELAENEENPQGIRMAAIEAMAYSPENEERLLQIYRTSKGKIKNSALLALAKMGSEAVEEQIKKVAEKPKKADFELLCTSCGKAAEDYARSENEHVMTNGIDDKDTSHPFTYVYDDLLANKKNVTDVFEKWAVDCRKRSGGDKVPYSKGAEYTSINEPLIRNIYLHDDKEYRDMIRYLHGKYPVYFAVSAFFLELVEDPENACRKICTDHRVYDRDIIHILRYIFTTPDGWYRIRNGLYFGERDYSNIKLFKAIPDDILDFLSDISVVYNYKTMEKELKTGQECDIARENMKQRCALFRKLLEICPKEDRSRVKAKAEKFAWAMARNYPCDEAMYLLTASTDKSLEGVIYDLAKASRYNNMNRYWVYTARQLNIPEEIVKKDCQRLMDELQGDEKLLSEVKQLLKNYE